MYHEMDMPLWLPEVEAELRPWPDATSADRENTPAVYRANRRSTGCSNYLRLWRGAA